MAGISDILESKQYWLSTSHGSQQSSKCFSGLGDSDYFRLRSTQTYYFELESAGLLYVYNHAEVYNSYQLEVSFLDGAAWDKMTGWLCS